MEISKVKINGNEYSIYNVELENGEIISVGSEELGNLINDCIENDKYLYPMVELENGEIIRIKTLDETIAFFLFDTPIPTKNDIINDYNFIYNN